MTTPKSHQLFEKILIVNRGEIANRLIKACHELGIQAVAIYSEADAGAPWVRLADESYPLQGVTAVSTYLDQEAIFTIARRSGAEAIHPGYGFLSENAAFAAACAERGFTFIGPTATAMRQMGSKAFARKVAQQAGVPVVPGIDAAGLSLDELQTAVGEMRYPVLIKASAGGGGKGMRVVWSENDLADAVQAAQREAHSSFGDDHILVEKYFTEIHHVEIQILADSHGNVLHLFERECSIQRRHQKIVEESPAPVIQDDGLRQRMAEAAVSLAENVNYINAGTVEFIVDGEGKFYFLEMNTRLQVEHPITELVTGMDLAVWQIRIAAGEELPFTQSDIEQRGHAIECRVYAEDPARQFLPSIGEISLYRPPTGPGVRVDDGIETGSQVTPYYDPMLAKVIAWGQNRPEAIRKMVQALRETAVLGVTTNIPYLLAILQEPTFLSGSTSTNYLQEHLPDWQPNPVTAKEEWLAAAAFEMLRGGRGSGGK
ncbi:MAG: acetyl-CoA carboxylase biotin carboxylase subunit, partial [Chloroflexi bacterium]